jgi:hypothetical protein
MANSKLVAPNLDNITKIYQMAVEMADRVSQRRQAANSFYLSVNTAIVGAGALLSSDERLRSAWILGIAGIAICALWLRNIDSYRTLNAAKFAVIHDIEKLLPIQAFTDEWKHLDAGGGRRHKPFHSTEAIVPIIFMGVHLLQIGMQVPWSKLRGGLKLISVLFSNL